MSDVQTIQNDLNAATAALDDLRGALRDGTPVDLDSFNRTVAETCEAAAALPRDDAPQVRAQLERLLAELNAARDEIVAEQKRLAAEIAAGDQPGSDGAVQD